MRAMRKVLISFGIVMFVWGVGNGDGISSTKEIPELCEKYVSAWKQFYPSRAYSLGFQGSIFHFEEISSKNISSWILFNRQTLDSIIKMMPELTVEERIDARLLRTQILSELDRWEREAPHKNSPGFYSGYIAQAIPRVLDSTILMPGEKVNLILQRLEKIRILCEEGKKMLEDGSPEDTQRCIKALERLAGYLEDRLPRHVRDWLQSSALEEFTSECRRTSGEIKSLLSFIRQKIKPNLTLSNSPILGREKYARMLRIYTDSDLTPERLEKLALEEIQEVRKIMAEASAAYLREAYPGQEVPGDFDILVNAALEDMEENRPSKEQKYLLKLREFAKQAEDFVRDKNIATLPENQTLSIELAPESAGPSARIGYVRPAPPFSPNPWTTWFLANIPDSFPAQEREDFWRSFNYHFKKFIVIHELYPGHYIQSKITRENPHQVRILFPFGLYSEGWATLCERVALEAGWDNGNKLTRLAQLRKRLENANRAYVSVQAHCRGWNEKQVLEFSVKTSLLAPQFAKSLWGRLMRSPMQITSYFLGYKQFDELFESEKKRLGPKFKILDFMDTILRAGPIPIDEFPAIFANRQN